MKTVFKKIVALVCAAAALTVTACAGEHTHTFEEKWTYDGSSHWHAPTCGHDEEKEGLAKHVFTEGESSATCTESGTVVRTCVCGYSETVFAPALGHNYETVPRLDPTCEKDGYTEHTACTRCGDTQGMRVILKTGKHFYDETNWTFDGRTHWHAATCGCDRKKDEAVHSLDGEGVCTVCKFVSPDAQADKEAEKLYVFSANGDTYTVSGLTAAGKAEKTLTLPASYHARTVSAVGVKAFAGSAAVSVNLPAGLTAIGNAAFRGCAALKEVNLPAGLTTIGDYAFENCALLSEISLPAGLTALGIFDYQVFNGCASLTAVTLPVGITSIGQNMFMGCSNLSGVVFQGKVTSVDTQAFYGCTALKALELDGVTYIGQMAFAKSGLQTVTLTMATNGRIASGAFAGCASLLEAEIGGDISSFAGQIFSGCAALQTLTLPFIGESKNAAANTSAAFGFVFGTSEPADKTAFTAAAQGGRTYYIPTSLKTVNVTGGTVSAGAFDNCSSLAAVNASAAVNVLAQQFENCTAVFTWEKA